jgi:hypothetical protein
MQRFTRIQNGPRLHSHEFTMVLVNSHEFTMVLAVYVNVAFTRERREQGDAVPRRKVLHLCVT